MRSLGTEKDPGLLLHGGEDCGYEEQEVGHLLVSPEVSQINENVVKGNLLIFLYIQQYHVL